ncbi:MAG: hypothetical protein PWP23_2706 [Candidatus Sumerlaeota bacterium]|nr:hypothetical protein [Candidatus Sumerlaeota bacterium]
MIKADIVKKITEELSLGGQPLKDKEALAIVDSIIDSVKEVIIRDRRLEIRDFGVFQVKQRKARIGRNPKNKKPYPIPAHHVVTFKPGKQIRTLSKPTADEDENDDT